MFLVYFFFFYIILDSTLDIGSSGYCENAISSTLKAFFKLLPDPLISDDIAAKVLVVNCESPPLSIRVLCCTGVMIKIIMIMVACFWSKEYALNANNIIYRTIVIDV